MISGFRGGWFCYWILNPGAFYLWTISPFSLLQIFFFFILRQGLTKLLRFSLSCWSWSQIWDPPASVSQIVEITSMCHHSLQDGDVLENYHSCPRFLLGNQTNPVECAFRDLPVISWGAGSLGHCCSGGLFCKSIAAPEWASRCFQRSRASRCSNKLGKSLDPSGKLLGNDTQGDIGTIIPDTRE